MMFVLGIDRGMSRFLNVQTGWSKPHLGAERNQFTNPIRIQSYELSKH